MGLATIGTGFHILNQECPGILGRDVHCGSSIYLCTSLPSAGGIIERHRLSNYKAEGM